MQPQFESTFDSLTSHPEQNVIVLLHKNYLVQLHTHDFYEVNVILSGRGMHCIEGHSFPVKKGDVFVIPANISHSYKDCRDLDVYHICIRQDLLKKYALDSAMVDGYDVLMEIEPFLRSNFDKRLFLSLSSAELNYIKGDLDLICSYPQPNPCEPLSRVTVMKLLYYMAQLLYQQLHTCQEHIGEAEQMILQALEYIHRNYTQKIDIASICQHVHASRPTFMRKFKVVCGCSPIHYLMEYRSAQARKLLAEGVLSKTQIACECGFYDLSHMKKYISKSSKKPDDF